MGAGTCCGDECGTPPDRGGRVGHGLREFVGGELLHPVERANGQFAARRINLSNLLSRPTKEGGLGDYCFIIYADGHIGEELMADTVRALHAKQGAVKFLGSYPAAGAHAAARDHADDRWRQADDWVASLRRQIRPNG